MCIRDSLPTAFRATHAVTVQLCRPDKRDVPHFAGERNSVVGKLKQRCELFNVMVLAGAHVSTNGHVQGHKGRSGCAAYLLNCREPVQHAEIHVVRVRLGDLTDALGRVEDPLWRFEDVEANRLALSGRVGEGDGVSHGSAPWVWFLLRAPTMYRRPTGRDSGARRRVHPVSYTHLRAHETVLDPVCRLL